MTRLVRAVSVLAAAVACLLLGGTTLASADLTEPPVAAGGEDKAQENGSILGPHFSTLSQAAGFESGGLKAGTDDLEVYWNGPLPDEALKVMADAEASGRKVHVVGTPYSFDEIQELSLKVADVLQKDGWMDISGFGPNRLHDTIEVLSSELNTNPQSQAEATQAVRAVVPADVDVVFLPGEDDAINF